MATTAAATTTWTTKVHSVQTISIPFIAIVSHGRCVWKRHIRTTTRTTSGKNALRMMIVIVKREWQQQDE